MITGVGASDGIVIGKIYKHQTKELVVTKETIEESGNEIERFLEAMEESKRDVEKIMARANIEMGEEAAAIFGAHLEILNDPELSSAIEKLIIDEKTNADYAAKNVCDSFASLFDSMENEYFSARAADIRDLSSRIVANIKGVKQTSLSEIEEEVIIVANDLSPSDTAVMQKDKVKGFITDIGGRTSHSAIMARILEIPAIVGTGNATTLLSSGDFVIMNGSTGEVIVNPDAATIEEQTAKIKAYNEQKAIWKEYRDKPSLTKDGGHLLIGANIGDVQDVNAAVENGSDGIGLFRTEFLFMGRNSFPTESEQYEAYKEVLSGMDAKPVIVRTLDIGGDKELGYFKMEEELNPFLGNRALRLCFSMPEVLKTQLRALLRASVHGDLHIMFPMIATLDELLKAKAVLRETQEELSRENIEVSDSYKVGIMIEIPAAALVVDVLAKEVDFLSIGTNDLIQYTFAADRMNEKVSYLYQPYNPSLLRLINMVIEGAHKEGKWVGMCGEMAGETDALALLIGMGLDEFSMSPSQVLKMRYLAEKIDSAEAGNLAKAALTCTSEKEVLELIGKFKDSDYKLIGMEV